MKVTLFRMADLFDLCNKLPGKPGIYKFLDKEGQIIYIGKAKNLKKRVSSYFRRTNYENRKILVLVKKVANIEYIIVESESDALLLENSLIKKFQPKYNIQLKDDKTFPWICVKNEPFPRVFHTRKYIKDGSLYFGPYTSMSTVRTILALIRQLFKIRTCNYFLSKTNIENNKFKPCLEYHLGNCMAPCIGNQLEDEYNENIDQVKYLLKGNISGVINYLKNLMNEYSTGLKFENAQEIKEKIMILEGYQSKSTVVNPAINDLDVFSYIDDEKSAFVNYMKIINGAINQSHTVQIKKRLNESKNDLLLFAIVDIRQRMFSESKEIVVPFFPGEGINDVKFVIPKKGDKKSLLNLSERNLKYFIAEHDKQAEQLKEKTPDNIILQQLKMDLKLPELPTHIECFDNSNIQGKNPVAACVVFKNGKPLKREYRHFNIKSVVGPNDFASMEEVIYRRYKRLREENKGLPQLIIIDGGKGQLSSAYKSLVKLDLSRQISIIGIAKRLEEIYVPKDPVPIYFDKSSPSLKLIQYMRNEAHRFGIQFHRQKRDKSSISSELNNIKGIGKQTVELLFSKFKSIEKIKNVTFESLAGIIGKSKAKIIQEYFKKEN